MITKFDAKWIGNGYELPIRFGLISDIPPQNAGIRHLRLVFRFEVAFVLINENGDMLFKNGWLPCFDFFTDNGRLIGPQDMSCADGSELQNTWRGACFERRMEMIK